MKAITILQPYASLLVAGKKTYETRSWDTPYRGKIAIHAGKGRPYERDKLFFQRAEELLGRSVDGLPRGAIIAVADLVECYQVCGNNVYNDPEREKRWLESRPALGKDGKPIRDADGHRIGWEELPMPDEQEQYFGHFGVGFYAWKLENITPLEEPIPIRGNQRLWEVPDSIFDAETKGE